MNFCWSTLRVNNLEESVTFYTQLLGLNIVGRFGAPGHEIVFLGDGETKIELICDGETRQSDAGQDISWGFEVESLDKALELVKEKGIKIDAGPIQPSPNVKFFFIKDPNGMKIQLVENMP